MGMALRRIALTEVLYFIAVPRTKSYFFFIHYHHIDK
jgi:hypothetical protein